jgi:putative transposase
MPGPSINGQGRNAGRFARGARSETARVCPFRYPSSWELSAPRSISNSGPVVLLTYQYRIYPFACQLRALEQHKRELAFLWNFALSERQEAWRNEHRSLSYLDQQRNLTRWRKYDREGLGRVSREVAQDCLQRLDLAFAAFFGRIRLGQKPGYPKYRRSVHSFTYTQRNPSPLMVQGRNGTWRLKVPRVGEIPLRLHRPLPAGGLVRTVTVKHDVGVWLATLVIDLPDPPPPPFSIPMKPVGVDVGLRNLATLSTGAFVEPPKFFRHSERTLAREQRRLSRRVPGSARHQRQRIRVVICESKIRRRRKSFAHRISRNWADQFDLIAFENTDTAAFRAGNSLAKGMMDAGWGMLRQMTHYKMFVRSKWCVDVPARGTTQSCFRCGRLANPPLTLSDRTYRCPCGWVADRDLNAAQNILSRGLTLHSELRRSTAEVTRTESRPPPQRKGRRSFQRRRAGSGNCEMAGNCPTAPGLRGLCMDPAEPSDLSGRGT